MTTRPILFSGEMVRAILDGRKTQTRRVMKPQPPEDVATLRLGRYNPTVVNRHGEEDAGPEIFGAYDDNGEYGCRCPYGEPGDRLWVRETFRIGDMSTLYETPHYRADTDEPEANGQWTSSIHMPRWASRITLDVTKVRAQRLHNAVHEDRVAEGWPLDPRRGEDYEVDVNASRDWFMDLWDSINAKRAPWASNPWVFVLEFMRAANG